MKVYNNECVSLHGKLVRSPGADPREGGPNKGEGLHYEAMQYLLYLNAGWKDKINILVYRTGEICLFLKPVQLG